MQEAKVVHKEDWTKSPLLIGITTKLGVHLNGKILKKTIIHTTKDEVESLKLKIVEANALERTNSSNPSEELNRVK